MIEIWKLMVGLGEWANNNLLGIFTALLALVTAVNVYVSSKNADRQAILTAESEIMPKIEPDFKKSKMPTGALIKFFLKDNNVQRPRISINTQGRERTACDECLFHEHVNDISVDANYGDWRIAVGNDVVTEFLIESDSKPPQSVIVTLSFESYTGRSYEYTYQLKLDHREDPNSDDPILWVDSYSLVARTLPWESSTSWRFPK